MHSGTDFNLHILANALLLTTIAALSRAAALEPTNSAWPRALANLHVKLGIWTKTMTELRAPLPPGTPAAEFFLKAQIK